VAAAGSPGPLAVLGAVSGARGAAAAGTVGPLKVRGASVRGVVAAGTSGPLEVLGVASEMRGAGAGGAAAEGTVGPLKVRGASVRGVAAAGSPGPLAVLGAVSRTRAAAAAGTSGPLEVLAVASGTRDAGAGGAAAAGTVGAPGKRGASVTGVAAGGSPGPLAVLGAVSGTRGAAAAETSGPLEVLGVASEARGAGAGGAAAAGTVGAPGKRGASVRGVAAAGSPGPLAVLGAASGMRGAVAAGTVGAPGKRGEDSEMRGAGESGIAGLFPGLQSASGSWVADAGTDDALPGRAPASGRRGAGADGGVTNVLGMGPETRGAAEAGMEGALTGLGATSGARGEDAPDGGTPGTRASGRRGVCMTAAPGFARAPPTTGFAVGGTVPGGAGGRAGPLASVGGAAGVAGALVVRGGGRPEPPVVGTAGEDGTREAAAGTIGLGARGQEGMVPVGMRSGARGTDPGDPLEPGDALGAPGAAVVGGGRAIVLPAVVAGRGPGAGVRMGGEESNAGPGRGMGVSIGIGGIGPPPAGGSSRKGSGVVREGAAGGSWRRSSGSSRLRISGGVRSGSMPGSQAVQSPCDGNSAPHLRHLDTAA
jgi:hypothetical protein